MPPNEPNEFAPEGLSSVRTTERSIGSKQRLLIAVNNYIRTEPARARAMDLGRRDAQCPMLNLILILLFFVLPLSLANAQVRQFADMSTQDFAALDKAKTVILVPGGVLEEHGPYLPSGTDGIFNQRFAEDIAKIVAARPGWTAVIMPSVPLGAGAANEIGKKYSFPGSCTVLPSTLRSVFMDLADQLGQQHFRWVLIVSGHGDPAHNRMLDQAGDYFHDTYGGEMVNIFGYLWAMNLPDRRTGQEQARDGLAEHATMVETSWILALAPAAVRPDYRSARALPGHTMSQLEAIASEPAWPGYFGAPSLATAALGQAEYKQWIEAGTSFIFSLLSGSNYRDLPRFGDVYADDPADTAAQANNERLQKQHEAWLSNKALSKPNK